MITFILSSSDTVTFISVGTFRFLDKFGIYSVECKNNFLNLLPERWSEVNNFIGYLYLIRDLFVYVSDELLGNLKFVSSVGIRYESYY